MSRNVAYVRDNEKALHEWMLLEEDFRLHPVRKERIHRVWGDESVNDCLSSDRRCMNLVRMPCRTLRMLIVRFVHHYGFRTNGHIMSVEKQIIITLHYLAHAGTYSGSSALFGHSRNGIGGVIERMLEPLNRLFMDEVQPVDQREIHSKFTTTDRMKAFQDCIGAIDGTHVQVYPPAKSAQTWRGRSNYPTTNCLGICDHDMLFTYFLVGGQGSMHDARVLDEARSKPELSFPTPISGKYYLGDSGYTNQIGFLTPFRGIRYHPHEYLRQDPTNEKEVFNKQHSSLRSVIERTFGIWKNKWHIVLYSNALVGFPLLKQLAIIRATVGLHNFVRRNKTEDEPENKEVKKVRRSKPLDFELPTHIDEEMEAMLRVDRYMDDFRKKLAKDIFKM